VFAERLTVVTGGPGTGKTTLVREVAALASARKVRLELCAPTGKAAQRLAHTTGRAAATIHRLAGRRVEDDEAPVDLTAPFDPRLADVEPLECGLLVCDEASMLTVELAAMLLALLPDGRTSCSSATPTSSRRSGPGPCSPTSSAAGPCRCPG
jgi:exodeoxyribonuclease V alpha subunit